MSKAIIAAMVSCPMLLISAGLMVPESPLERSTDLLAAHVSRDDAARDQVELKGQLVLLSEFLGQAGTPSKRDEKPGAAPGPMGLLVKNDERSGRRDQLYVLVPKIELEPGPRAITPGTEVTIKGSIAEKAGLKAIIVTEKLPRVEPPRPSRPAEPETPRKP